MTSVSDLITHNCKKSVSIKWIEDYDYDLYQFVRKTYNNSHYSSILLSIDAKRNQLNISLINKEHNNVLFLESKSLDHLNFMFEQGIKKLFVNDGGETNERRIIGSYAAF